MSEVWRSAVLGALIATGCRPPAPALPGPVGDLPPEASSLFAEIGRPAREKALSGGAAEGLFLSASLNRFDPDPLVGAPAVFGAMADEIEAAEEEVLFQTYHLEPHSDPVKVLMEGLSRLGARRSRLPPSAPRVEVRLLLDDLAARQPAQVLLPELAAEVEALGLDPARVHVVIGAHTHLRSDSHHAKSLVVDGRRAVVTGANADRSFGFAGPWFDAGYRMEGEIAGALREEQVDAWLHGREWVCGARLIDELQSERCLVRPAPLSPLSQAGVLPGSSAPVPAFLVTRAADPGLGARPDDPLDEALLGAFAAARISIRIQTPDLNSKAGVDALVEAARRGVQVDLVLSRRFNELAEELPGQGGTNEKVIATMIETLRRLGIRDACERLRVRWFSLDGLRPVEGKGPGASHAKFFSIDDSVVLVGSANMDTQSWSHSRELLVAVDDPGITRAWGQAIFDPSFGRGVPAEPCR